MYSETCKVCSKTAKRWRSVPDKRRGTHEANCTRFQEEEQDDAEKEGEDGASLSCAWVSLFMVVVVVVVVVALPDLVRKGMVCLSAAWERRQQAE